MGEGLSRRQFVQWTGGLAAVVLVDGNPLARAVAAAGRALATLGAPTRTVRVLRASDQLDVLVELYGADVVGGDIVPTGSDPIVRFVFGPQHVAERHFPLAASVPTTAAAHMAAGTSVVVIAVPGTTPFSLDGLLDLAESSPGIVGQSSAGTPDGTVTALELPASLVLSPATGTRLRAPRLPRTVDDVTEVWVARLEKAAAINPVDVYAIENLSTVDLVSRLPTRRDRPRIVTNSTTIAPLTASRLWLSSAGAFARLRGEWAGQALERYRHTISGGRDIFVETVDTGYLLPFGHRAAIVSVAEREWTTDAGGGQIAAVRLRRFLDVIEPNVSSNRSGEPNKGRGSPFTLVTATTDESLPIVRTAVSDGSGVIPGASFVKQLDGTTDVMVDYRCVDRDGSTVTFSLPATFLGTDDAFGTTATSPAGRLRTYMNANARRLRRTVDLTGQAVAFADPIVAGIGATSRATFDLQFEWVAAVGKTETQLASAGSPSSYAKVKRASIVDPSVNALVGSTSQPFDVTLHPRWLTYGTNAGNFDQAYLTLVRAKTSTVGGDSPVRGVVALELTAEVLNQTAGAGLDLPSADAPWDPAEALGDAATIIGGISLEDILDVVDIGDAVPGIDIPGASVVVDGNTITTTFAYEPGIHTNESIGFLTTARSRAQVTVTSIVSVDGSTEPEFVTEVCLYEFTLRFLPGAANPLVDVHFDEACALVSSSTGFDVRCDVSGVTVYGDLEFLLDLFSGASFADPSVVVDDDGIDLSVTVNLPDVALGVLTVSGISIDFFMFLPLVDEPGRLAIDVGTKKDPLTLSVMSFGGTFYCGLDLRFGEGADQDTMVVGMSMFWEIVKIDVIIAKITVTLRVAADFRLQGQDVVFTGTVSIEGVISLCGFVEVSLTAAISLTYRSAQQEMVLKGTLFWAVDTFLGGADGKVQLGQTTIDISSDGNRALGSASFGDLYTSASWADYCDAFA